MEGSKIRGLLANQQASSIVFSKDLILAFILSNKSPFHQAKGECLRAIILLHLLFFIVDRKTEYLLLDITTRLESFGAERNEYRS